MEVNNFETFFPSTTTPTPTTSSHPTIMYSQPFSQPQTSEESFSSTMSTVPDVHSFETHVATLSSSITSSGGGIELSTSDNKGSDFEAFEKILFGSHYDHDFASDELEELLKDCDAISFDDALSIKQTTNSVSQFASTVESVNPHFTFTFPIVSSPNNEHVSCIRKVTIEFSSTSSVHHVAEIRFSHDGSQIPPPQPRITCHKQKNKGTRRGKTTAQPRRKLSSSGAVAVPKNPKAKPRTAVGTTSSSKTKRGAAKKKEGEAKKTNGKPKKQTTKRIVARKAKVENEKVCPMQCRVVLTRLPESQSLSLSRKSERIKYYPYQKYGSDNYF
ncbi:uncharacterized protein LOC110845608 [Folsomia candida]|uniref:uncharacterized protein LOC110845608 n=1 Tax=Folsomia candida TaxID=158441 RepID=UPI000B8FE899|nr:uncharacterized protein LOC110845608 [Folsomia candida]